MHHEANKSVVHVSLALTSPCTDIYSSQPCCSRVVRVDMDTPPEAGPLALQIVSAFWKKLFAFCNMSNFCADRLLRFKRHGNSLLSKFPLAKHCQQSVCVGLNSFHCTVDVFIQSLQSLWIPRPCVAEIHQRLVLCPQQLILLKRRKAHKQWQED